VREALRRLAAEGLIEHLPHRGALVRRLSRTDMRELFQIRIELEALATRLAAEIDDSDHRAAFRAAIEPIFDDAPRQNHAYMAENAAFHDAILTLAGNRLLHDLAIRLQLPLIMAQVGDALTPTILESSVREHRAIANAILQRDPRGAVSALRDHLERAAALALSRREN
jgi:DNA-binding GntR family transcriptional regulator